MTMPANLLWTTVDDPDTVNTCPELLRSTANTYARQIRLLVKWCTIGKYRHVVLPRVATTAIGANDSTKAKYWGLASTEMSTAYLGVHEEARLNSSPADGKSDEEFSTDDWNFGTRGGWMIVIVSAGWVSFSSGDGVA